MAKRVTFSSPETIAELMSVLREAKKREFRERAVWRLLADYLGDRDPTEGEVRMLHAILVELWNEDPDTSPETVAKLWKACASVARATDDDEALVGRIAHDLCPDVFLPLYAKASGKDDLGGPTYGHTINAAQLVEDALEAFRFSRPVGHCNHCGYPFVALRPATAYCSPNCKSMAATYRQRSKET